MRYGGDAQPRCQPPKRKTPGPFELGAFFDKDPDGDLL